MKTRKEKHVPMHKGGTHTYNCLNDGYSGQCNCESLSKDANELEHTPTPWRKILAPTQIVTDDRIIANMVYGEYFQMQNDADFIVRAVNAHEALLEAAKNARNVLAALAIGDLKGIKADSPALQMLRDAIAKAEGK
jgi:hypothetical protein